MMRYAYFPGCSAHSTGISYTLSIEYIANKMGIELKEIPDWNCCGTSAARLTNADLMLALPARSLALSEKMDSTLDVVAPCAGCYQSLKTSEHYAKESDENRKHIEDLIHMPYAASADVLNVVDILTTDEAVEAIKADITKKFAGLKVACYYGCALVRPTELCNPDSPENPMVMEKLVEMTGAEPVEWAFKTECCGASNHITAPRAAKSMVARIFEDAAANGTDIIVTACPLCWMNLDMREDEVNARFHTKYDIPVYYITELLGAAMGGSATELGLDRHFRPAAGLIDKLEDAKAASEDADAAEAEAEPADTATQAPASDAKEVIA